NPVHWHPETSRVEVEHEIASKIKGDIDMCDKLQLGETSRNTPFIRFGTKKSEVQILSPRPSSRPACRRQRSTGPKSTRGRRASVAPRLSESFTFDRIQRESAASSGSIRLDGMPQRTTPCASARRRTSGLPWPCGTVAMRRPHSGAVAVSRAILLGGSCYFLPTVTSPNVMKT